MTFCTKNPQIIYGGSVNPKNVADITDKLVDLQGKMKDINQETVKTTNNVTNAMFVGSTSELQKMLKEMGKDK